MAVNHAERQPGRDRRIDRVAPFGKGGERRPGGEGLHGGRKPVHRRIGRRRPGRERDPGPDEAQRDESG